MILEELINVIEEFDNTSVLVIGDLMLDRYLLGRVSRISPEAPVPLVDVESESFRLGGAASAINKIFSLGGTVFSVGVVGDDWFGKQLATLLMKENPDQNFIIELKERPTTVKTRVIADQHQILRLDRETKEPISNESTQEILNFICGNIQKVGAILISDYNKGVVTNKLLKGTIELGNKLNIPIIVYPKVGQFLDYKGVTIVILDLKMASSVTGIKKINETSVRNMGHWLLRHLNCTNVLLTDEIEGFTLFEKSGSVTHISSIANEIRNITGTIDMAASCIALSQASGKIKIVDSSRLANIAVGVHVEKRESDPLTQDELIEKIRTFMKNNVNVDKMPL